MFYVSAAQKHFIRLHGSLQQFDHDDDVSGPFFLAHTI
jgi:hypothetical protein